MTKCPMCKAKIINGMCIESIWHYNENTFVPKPIEPVEKFKCPECNNPDCEVAKIVNSPSDELGGMGGEKCIYKDNWEETLDDVEKMYPGAISTWSTEDWKSFIKRTLSTTITTERAR